MSTPVVADVPHAPLTHSSEIDDFDFDLDLLEMKADMKRGRPRNMAKFVRLRDKIGFTVGVINLVLTGIIFGGYPWLLPLFYTLKAPFLIFTRLYLYRKQNMHFFLLDFCYFCNVIILTFLWVLPDNKYAMAVAFGISTGPMAWATALFRNSMVFHSLDKITSVFIHLTPGLVMYCIRWYGSANSPVGFQPLYAVCPVDEDCAGFFWLSVVPYLLCICHQLLYVFLIKCVCKLPEDRNYLTLYRWVTSTNPLFTRCKPRDRLLGFTLFNNVYAAISFSLTTLWYRSQVLQFAFHALLVTVSSWNGANFYVEVFSLRYDGWTSSERENKAKRAAERKAKKEEEKRKAAAAVEDV